MEQIAVQNPDNIIFEKDNENLQNIIFEKDNENLQNIIFVNDNEKKQDNIPSAGDDKPATNIIDFIKCDVCCQSFYKPVVGLCQHIFCRKCVIKSQNKKIDANVGEFPFAIKNRNQCPAPNCKIPFVVPRDYSAELDNISKLIDPIGYKKNEEIDRVDNLRLAEIDRIRIELRRELFNANAEKMPNLIHGNNMLNQHGNNINLGVMNNQGDNHENNMINHIINVDDIDVNDINLGGPQFIGMYRAPVDHQKEFRNYVEYHVENFMLGAFIGHGMHQLVVYSRVLDPIITRYMSYMKRVDPDSKLNLYSGMLSITAAIALSVHLYMDRKHRFKGTPMYC